MINNNIVNNINRPSLDAYGGNQLNRIDLGIGSASNNRQGLQRTKSKDAI